MKKISLFSLGFMVLLLFGFGFVADAADKGEFMTADEFLALQTFKGKPVLKKGDPGHGRQLYTLYCTPCHGMKGNGKGQIAKLLDPNPRDHTDGKGKRPGDGMNDRTDQQLFNAITKGGQGIKKSVNMPAWGHIISEESRWDLVAYLRTIAVPEYVPK
ncbi:MAG: c-type cytochrome [Nitrospiria bacterium]